MSTRFLCDTNVISEIMRPRPQPEVRHWLESQDRIFLSVLSLEELHFGLQWKNLVQKRTWLDRFVAARCECLAIDAPIAILAGEMRGELAKKGQTRTQADLLIAATATAHHAILATHNTRDFEDLNLPLFNPFLPRPS